MPHPGVDGCVYGVTNWSRSEQGVTYVSLAECVRRAVVNISELSLERC